MSKRSGTDGSLLNSLPWTLAALAFSVVPHIQFLPIWVTLIFAACSVYRFLVERNRWRLPPAWLRIVVSLLCFIGVLASYESVSGVGPGSALLVVMAALKLMETKRRRDQFVLLFISIFLIMSSLLREQYIWSLPYLVAGVAFTMTAWLRMSNGRQVGARSSLATAGRLLLYAAPLTIAMWVFFPRIATPFWAVPIDTSSATSGLSDRMSPGDISSLSQSNEVAFRVNFASDVPPPHERYWRGLVLTNFNGRTWSGTDQGRGSGAYDAVEFLGEATEYQVMIEPTQQRWIFALDVAQSWSNVDKIYMGSQQQLIMEQPIDQRMTYEMVSHTDFHIAHHRPRQWLDWYLRLDEEGTSNPRTRALALEMREQAGSDEVFINRILAKFNREAYYYTLEPPALGSNSVDAFLFDTKQGFCEHYASAFTVLMRAAGIPARIVVGYQGGEVNPMSNWMIVRQADAHAWTEVWLPRRGWYRVDPTAAVAPERIEAGRSGAMFDGIGATWGFKAPSQWIYQLQMTWDALNANWNEFILAYGPENQSRLMQALGMDNPNWQKMMFTLIAIIIVLILGLSTLLMLRYRPPPKDQAAVLYEKFARATGVAEVTGEAPLHFASRIANEKADIADESSDITAQYLDARYGPPDLVALHNLKEAVTKFSAKN